MIGLLILLFSHQFYWSGRNEIPNIATFPRNINSLNEEDIKAYDKAKIAGTTASPGISTKSIASSVNPVKHPDILNKQDATDTIISGIFQAVSSESTHIKVMLRPRSSIPPSKEMTASGIPIFKFSYQ